MGFIVTFVILGVGLNPASWRTVASILGLRMIPGVLYYFAPAWWYIGLVLQLYAVFPYLFKLLKKLRPLPFLAVVGGGGVLIRGMGLLLFSVYAPEYLDWWSRGAVFVSRLGEFAFGMFFAVVFAERRELVERLTRGRWAVLGWALLYVLGNFLSFFLLGMSVAFVLTGASAFVLLYRIGNHWRPWALRWVGSNSYPIFLVHHPVIIYLVPASLSIAATARVGLYFAVAAVVTIAVAVALDRVTGQVVRGFSSRRRRLGSRKLAILCAASVFAVVILLFGAEAAVRTFDPQEIYGWGERPALRPDDQFSYTLKPNRTTRLRWQSYDYVVEANELGFPGPIYPEARDPSTYRILVTGDAFSSAEGVAPDASWPRLLEKTLGISGLQVEVLNFSITGWGPRQYAAAVRHFAPVYSPDLVVVTFFVNDFADAQISDNQFHRSIGFDRPPPNGLRSFVTLQHLQKWTELVLRPKIKSLLGRGGNPLGYFFANVRHFERANVDALVAAAPLVHEELREISIVSKRVNADLLVLLVPASPQVVPTEDLDYFPRDIDINDQGRFDLDQPQRFARKICSELNIDYVDLRPVLRAGVYQRPYQSANMHWTENGHAIVAQALAKKVFIDF